MLPGILEDALSFVFIFGEVRMCATKVPWDFLLSERMLKGHRGNTKHEPRNRNDENFPSGWNGGVGKFNMDIQ
jgi:hypothetical protein